MVDENGPEVESDLRRRAAWLLGMLAVVAVLFVIVLSTVIGTGGGGKHNLDSGPLDPAVTTPRSSSSSHPGSGHASTTAPATGQGTRSCPTSQRCALDGDAGNAVDAINSYRTSHGQSAVAGAASAAAGACALSNGSACSGNWAETPVATLDGKAAVNKIVEFAKLLDPQLKSFGVGWAYDPPSKQYFFAVIRND